MKCKEYEQYSVLCQQCLVQNNPACEKIFDLDIPKKFVRVERRDTLSISWNECPTCGTSIGYHPDKKDFKCPKCNQKILWED